jgi:hypothetical protein
MGLDLLILSHGMDTEIEKIGEENEGNLLLMRVTVPKMYTVHCTLYGKRVV